MTNQKMSMAYGLEPGEKFRLNNFTYSSDALVNIIFKHLSNTAFDGITVSGWVWVKALLFSYHLCF